jgi:hypothetical protein
VKAPESGDFCIRRDTRPEVTAEGVNVAVVVGMSRQKWCVATDRVVIRSCRRRGGGDGGMDRSTAAAWPTMMFLWYDWRTLGVVVSVDKTIIARKSSLPPFCRAPCW